MTVSEEGLFSASDVEVGLTGRPIRELPEPAPLEKHGPATIISMCNQKGGVGKTTLAVQLAVARALAGRDVWLIDGDRQGTAAAAIAAKKTKARPRPSS